MMSSDVVEGKDSFWLENVPGVEDSMRNDLYIIRPSTVATTKCVIFFPGDIQDQESRMLATTGARDFVEYSIERTARVLANKFPEFILVCVCPSRRIDGYMSAYQNFVHIVEGRNVSYCSQGRAVQHLVRLLENCGISQQVESIELLGFSRGGVVLNQIVEESQAYRKNLSFWQRLNKIIWIDSGNSPNRGSYPSRQAISQLSKALKDCGEQCSLHVFGTPYQLENAKARPYNKKEVTEMFQELKMQGYQHHSFKMLHENSFPSLQVHFQALRDFQL
jgi:hypothetical protein